VNDVGVIGFGRMSGMALKVMVSATCFPNLTSKRLVAWIVKALLSSTFSVSSAFKPSGGPCVSRVKCFDVVVYVSCTTSYRLDFASNKPGVS
jgi:hypothetical protein